ncbi:MAG: hypothetical protein J6B07_03360 [Opitutales bacterium]|nr:hypothetical protein [Opitutales bacterium]
MAKNKPNKQVNTQKHNINLSSDIGNQLTIHKNIEQEIVIVNIDKVRLILNEHNSNIKKRLDWINPLALFLAILTANLTADFKDFWGIPAPTWDAIFILLGFASGIYLFYAFCSCFSRKSTIDDVIEKLKQHTEH